jgi:putative redox protein
MTQPMGVNGADLLPLSLIGCSAWDVADLARKQNQSLTRLEVTAESDQDPEPPWRFRRIRIHYLFFGRDLDPALLRRSIELSEERYCSIYATLRDAVELTSDFEVVEG